MQLIKNNPYRIIGLLAGTTAKEQDRQIRRLKQYLAAEQEPECDYSFPCLGELDRTLEDVAEASSRLNLDNDKITAALFWFYNGNAITDEPAFESLKDGNVQECTDIWFKLTASGEITKRNSSAYHNLSTLLLRKSFISSGIDEKILKEAISYKIEFLESEFIKDFIVRTTDETFKTNKEQLQLIFLRLLHAEIKRHGGINTIEYYEIINKCDFAAKEEFFKEFISKPIELIERKIKEAENNRKDNMNDAIKTGNALYNQTKNSLSLLKSVLGSSSIKYISISDKVSEEILQCGINYFNQYKDSQDDVSLVVMNVFKIASSLGCGNIAKQRCQENINNLQEWIDEKPERDKRRLIEYDLEVILNKQKQLESILQSYQKKNSNPIDCFIVFNNYLMYHNKDIENTNQILNDLEPSLQKIKSVLGKNDELYLKICNSLSFLEFNIVIDAVNLAQESYTKNKYSLQNDERKDLLNVVISAINIINKLEFFDMNYDQRQHLEKNAVAIKNLKDKLEPSGCYIATMAYGSYDHPQVLILRQFRDEVLDKSAFGKWFIKTYYLYSPMLVEKLKDHKKTNILIRKLLNQIIKLIEP